MTKVENLVEELVDEDKVLVDGVLSDLVKVGLECVDNLVQKLKDKSSIHVLSGNCSNKNLSNLDVEESCTSHVTDRSSDFFCVQDIAFECSSDLTTI